MKCYNLVSEVKVDGEVHSFRNVWKYQPIFSKMSEAFTSILDEYADEVNGVKIPKLDNIPINISRIFDDNFSLIIEFSENDFINKSSYRGAQKLFRANRSTPQYLKRYWGKSVGMTHSIGFKITDYDQSYNVLAINNIKGVGNKFVDQVLVPKMKVEFPAFPEHMFEESYSIEQHIEDRGWLKISNMTPQEKIVLANKYNVEPFPNSLYENDRGAFNKRVIESEYDTRLESELAPISDIRDYEANETDSAFEIMDKTIMEREMSFQDGVRDGFDYGDFQEFSDIYTRTETRFEDYELYPVRTNCLPKAVRKRGKSPYDTKLGVREWRYFNVYQKPEPYRAWVQKSSPKYNWEREEIDVEYNLPDNFWEEIEMAYQQR